VYVVGKGKFMAKSLIVAWIFVGVISFAAYLIRPENRLAFGVTALVALIGAVPLVKEWIRRKREGYYVRTRGNAEGGDVIYDEDGKSLIFYFDRGARTIYIPSDRKWEEMPEWAKSRKLEIVKRIEKRMGKDWVFEEKVD
jgi:hypothetical protein